MAEESVAREDVATLRTKSGLQLSYEATDVGIWML